MTATIEPAQSAPPDETFFTLQEACELLPSRPSYSTVLRWTREGKLRSRYIGGRRLIAVDDLADFAGRYSGQRLFR